MTVDLIKQIVKHLEDTMWRWHTTTLTEDCTESSYVCAGCGAYRPEHHDSCLRKGLIRECHQYLVPPPRRGCLKGRPKLRLIHGGKL